MWFSDPTADPFFWPFIKVIGSVLGVVFVVLLHVMKLGDGGVQVLERL